jgi:hypothetical protein
MNEPTDERTNNDRANQARRALREYLRDGSQQDAVQDLLSDLMHFSQRESLSFTTILEIAQHNYESEQENTK